MGFDRVAAVFAATLGHFSTASNSGSSVSPPPLLPSDSSFRSAWAGYGRTAGLPLSTSLQDFSTYCRVGDEETDSALGSSAGVLRTKSSSVRLQKEDAGGSISFSKEKLLLTRLISRRWLQAAVGFSLMLILLALFYLGLGWLKSYWTLQPSHFSVILDCGSTGTRVYVYEWLHNDGERQENLPMVLRSFPDGADRKSGQQSGRAYHRMETEPGFDKLLHNESGLRVAIEPLLQWAEEKIPPHARRNSPLFLLATAGLRRLPSSDSEWILDKAWSILQESSFMCRRSWVKIITGVEEAYYGWVALNYDMNRLRNVPRQATFGALDLGGSSLQVTFESANVMQGESGLNLSIGSMKHHLNAYSLSGYGLNDAFEKSVVLLLRHGNVKSSNDRLFVNHPCLHAGYRQQYSCSQCSFLHQEESFLVGGGNKGRDGSAAVIDLIGMPNWDKCQALAKSTVNASEWSQSTVGTDCKQHSCALSNHHPQPHGQFYAMSGFFVVYKFFNLTSNASLNDILEKGQHFCRRTWQDAESSVVPQPLIEQYCFRAPYVVALLRDGLHLKDKQIVVGSGSITWTLGAALLEAGSLWSSRIGVMRKEHFDLDPFTIAAALFILLVLVIFSVSCIHKGVLRLWHKPHLPLFRHQTASSSPVLKLPSPFRYQINNLVTNGVAAGRAGEGRLKLPHSPTTLGFQQPFGLGQTFAGEKVQVLDSVVYQSPTSVGLSFSASGLGQMQNNTGTLRTPHRGQTRLQSRRSQSREDLRLSVLESHMVML